MERTTAVAVINTEIMEVLARHGLSTRTEDVLRAVHALPDPDDKERLRAYRNEVSRLRANLEDAIEELNRYVGDAT